MRTTGHNDGGMGDRRTGDGAFSLIEVSLALLVFGIGIMGILALFPGGLKLSSDSYMETRMASFAELALNSVAVELERNPSLWNQSEWKNYEIPASQPAFGVWQDEDEMVLIAGYTNATQNTVTNRYRVSVGGGEPDVEDFVFRYRLYVKRASQSVVVLWSEQKQRYYTPTTFKLDQLEADDPRVRATNEHFAVMNSPVKEWESAGDFIYKAELAIWPGEFGEKPGISTGITTGSRPLCRHCAIRESGSR